MPSLRAVLINGPLVILATIVYGIAGVAVSLFDNNGDAQMRVARAWGRMLLRIPGVEVTVEGMDRIQPGASYVLAANHVSYMDTPVVLANIPVQFRFMAKEGLFQIPLLGTHLSRAGHIPVTRADPRAAVKTLLKAAEMIRARGVSLLIFPEGGRTEDGKLQEFKEGAAYIAIKAGVPLVPIALVGTGDVLPMHSAQIRRAPVTLRIGEPIETAGLHLRERSRINEQLRNQMGALLHGTPVDEVHIESVNSKLGDG